MQSKMFGSKLFKLTAYTLVSLCLAGDVFGMIEWPGTADIRMEEFSNPEPSVTKDKTLPTSVQLRNIAKEYLTFMRDVFSVPAATSNDPRLKTLFAKDLTKIDNRSILFENNRDALFAQMTGFKKGELVSDWMIDVEHALIIPSTETNTVVVYFEWAHPKIGRHTTIAILKCNDDMKIEYITDVWAPVKKEDNHRNPSLD